MIGKIVEELKDNIYVVYIIVCSVGIIGLYLIGGVA